MFSSFELGVVETSFGTIRFRQGGSGKPLLLLHGHPRCHLTWWKVAELLAPEFRVICPDVPGFGRSYQPEDTPDSGGSTKRAKAAALVDFMRLLGHERFAVVGHDRGALTAFRMAMDHPDTVERLVTVDGLPVLEHLERADWKFARDWYHWFFFDQAEKPERAILADPLAWYSALSPDLMGQEAYEEMVHLVHDPAVVHGMIEDYRAGLRIDHMHDAADRQAGRKVQCPLLCLWSQFDDLEQIYGDPTLIWKNWAHDVQGYGLPSGHHMAEENPAALATALCQFLAGAIRGATMLRPY